MKQKTVLLVILCMVFLTACGSRSESVTVTEASQWPSHAPGATPYVRLEIENNEMPASEDTQNTADQYESYEDFINSIYATEGDLYAKKWELAMFKEELPQDEPYSFAVHTNAMLTGSDTSDDHIALAKKFAELGCEAKVKEMRSVEDGKEYIAWVTVITTTPSHLWEISSSLGEELHIEQLYKSVDIRFDTVIWPEE